MESGRGQRVTSSWYASCFFFQAEDGIRDIGVTGVQTCALPIYAPERRGGGQIPGGRPAAAGAQGGRQRQRGPRRDAAADRRPAGQQGGGRAVPEIGRASCRERV